MAFRSLTNVYLIMRNNASASRSVFHDNQFADDREALVIDLERGSAKIASKAPPEWANDVDEIQYEMTKIKNKLKELSNLHDRHLNRPTLDDNLEEEHSIDLLTQEITQMVGQCQSRIRRLSILVNNFNASQTDKRLIKNVVNNLASQLQELTTNFRKNQNGYLKKIQDRKERSNMLFDTSQYGGGTGSSALMAEDSTFSQENYESYRQEQLQINKVNSQLLNEREVEINHIVKSIHDLNELFKDLATMVVDQGTVLDRIDCNIERVSQSVQSGLTQLQKAASYQKTNRKMYAIMCLAIVFIILLLLLVLTKF